MSSSVEHHSASGSGSGNGSGTAARTLGDVMREPSTTAPDVVVLDDVHAEVKPKVYIDPKKDLWLSTVDGRHQSPIIPVRVGPNAETFYIHRDVLTKVEYFRKALDGPFREAEEQAIDLPEEDPTIFSFVVAFMYESRYQPIKPLAFALVPDPGKGKGKEVEEDVHASSSDSSSDSDTGSDNSARSRRRAEARRRRAQRDLEERNRKEPGRHRPDCSCTMCTGEIRGPPCWNCGVPRSRPPPPRPGVVLIGRNGMPVRHHERHNRRGGRNRVIDDIIMEPRMTADDIRSWVMAYSLSIDVYVCAERFLMYEFKGCIAECIVHNFEVAGVDAAQPEVLASCKKLHAGLINTDTLLKKVFARVGFLLARLWKNFPEETHNFWMEYPDVGALIMKETMERRAADSGDSLPAMDRPRSRTRSPPFREEIIIERRNYR